MTLTPKQKKVYQYIKESENNGHPSSASAISIHFFLSLRNAMNIINKLIDKNYIEKFGSYSFIIKNEDKI